MSQPLSRLTLYAHGSIGLPLAVIGYPLAIWIPAHYAGGLGIELATVGTILMLARLTDVITDPIMGEISDRWKTPFGRRRPWLLVGAPIMMYGVYKLFIPPEGIGMFYFLGFLTMFFLGSTIIALPHRAWGAELSNDYHQRSRVTAAREFYVLMGLLLAAAVPMIVEIMADGGGSVLKVLSIIWQDAVGAFTGELANKVVADRRTLTGPVLIIALMVTFGEAFRNAVSLFFIRDIIGVPTIGAAYFFYFIAGLGAIPFWLWLGRKIGKHLAFMGTLILVMLVSAANLLLGYGDYLQFFTLFIIKGFCYGGLQFLPVAMLADVVDVDTARSGGRRAGTYFSILGLTEKLAVAFGTGFSLNLVGLLGFNAGGVDASTDSGVLALRLVYCLGPIFFYSIAMTFIWSYPLTPERHERLRARIERRAARLSPEP